VRRPPHPPGPHPPPTAAPDPHLPTAHGVSPMMRPDLAHDAAGDPGDHDRRASCHHHPPPPSRLGLWVDHLSEAHPWGSRHSHPAPTDPMSTAGHEQLAEAAVLYGEPSLFYRLK